MGRVLAVGLVGFLVAATFILPQPRQASPGGSPDARPPRFAVCLVEEGVGRSTEISVASMTGGRVQLSLFTAGRAAGSIGVDLPDAGATVFPIVDVAAVGTVGALVEFPAGDGAAASLIRGAESLATDVCVAGTEPEAYLTGGRTVLPDRFELHLVNPFASDAVARLVVNSEVGLESNPVFNSIVVRARSSVALNMNQLTPGRQRLSVLVESQVGRVVAIGRQTAPAESAMWSAIAPATDWYLPLGPLEGRRVVIGNPYSSGVEYQIDSYGPGGPSLAALSGFIPPGGEVTVDLSELDELAPTALRIITTTPVVAMVWHQAQSGLSAMAGSPATGLRWLVPAALHSGPGSDDPDQPAVPAETGTLIIFNPGVDEAEVVVSVVANGDDSTVFLVPGESTITVPMGPGDARIVVSTSPVVVAWFGGEGGDGSASPGVLLTDG